MKLYTEEQVRKAIDRGYSSAMCEDSTITKTADDFLQSLPPIELPSDEEIEKDLFYQKQVMNPYSTEAYAYTAYEKGFMDCAKWMKEQILKQNK